MKKSLLNTMFDDISLFTFKEGTKLRTDIKEYANQYVFELMLQDMIRKILILELKIII